MPTHTKLAAVSPRARATFPNPAHPGVASPLEVPSRPLSGCEDDERETRWLLEFVESGSHAAFDRLYESAAVNLMSWIRQLLVTRGDQRDPLDCLQDTFVNIYRYAGGFRENSGRGFRRWARTIAANVVRRSRRSRHLQLSPLAEQGFDQEDLRPGPGMLVMSSEEAIAIAQAWQILLLRFALAFEDLSERDQEALRHVEIEGLSYRETAGILGVGASNMKMIVFRARKRLRAHVARLLEGVDPRESSKRAG